MTSIGTLAAIAINRYIIISRSFLGQNLSGSSSTMTIVLIWLYSLSIALPPLLGWNRYIVEFPGIACSLDWQTPPLSWDGSYIIYIFVIGYVVPILIMVFCYGRVVWMLKAWSKHSGRCTTAKAERKVTIMSSVMVFCTVCAWTPYAVVSLMVFLKYEHLLGPVSSVAPAIFAKSSTVYNPIVYFYFNSQMREALVAKIPSMLRAPRPSMSDISMETKRGVTFGATASMNTQNIHVDGIATTENL